ncbi:TonB-dependent receptor plug domain-containing protein [Acetobacter sp.]|jgi:iron complex outermembrane receptor protein|uniref:TonB-dependent receptor plug domain-containing protein n=1 Tax=Acetobacter sp. TaxID=440 RepID=UPI0025B9D52A|nr:TonB-dependent receptor [Acetobacter sp.]MCH4090915.1 TonB-dependent receptor [Acetobacter sp.]MCI1300756.1 TonB-dependent receptor [Acetobacter sp.]MCI1317139.1 TonB-dependent receptor [Acetobacter sp.]
MSVPATKRHNRLCLRFSSVLSFSTALALCSLIFPDHQAYAQNLDYGTFEKLFNEPITSSATGKPQRASELPTDIQVVTAEQIRTSGAQTLPEVLRMVPGVDVRRYSVLSANVSIRGNDAAGGSRTLVLIDGRQVYLDGYNYTDWGALPVSIRDIRQIEVIKGPNSAVYGFNASGGVINIVTRDPQHENKSYVHVEGGSLNGFAGELVASHKFSDAFAAKLSLNGLRSDEYDRRSGRNVPAQTSNINAALEFRGQISPRIEWGLTGTIDQERSPFWLDIGTYFTSRPLAKSLEGRLAADTDWGLIEFRAYQNSFINEATDDIAAFGTIIPIRFGYDLETTVSQLSDTIAINSKNDLRLGVEYRYSSLSGTQAGTKIGSESDMLASGSAVWDYRILPELTLTNAVRVDSFLVSSVKSPIMVNAPTAPARYYVEPSFNSRIRYDAGDLGTFGLNAARGIQLPALFDFAPTTMLGPVTIINNPSLAPSTTINIGFNYSHGIKPLDGSLSIALFAQRTSEMLGTPFASNYSYVPPASLTMFPQNYNRVDDAGGEIRLEGKTDFNLHWDLSYAMASVRDPNKSSAINFQRQTPVNTVIGGFEYVLGQVEFSAHARWQSHYQDVAADFSTFQLKDIKVKDFVTLNARVGWKIDEHFRLSLSGQQLGDARLKETSGLRIDRRIIAGLTAGF